jgi:hypothetical protein
MKRQRPTLSGIDIAAPGGLDALFAHHRARFGDAQMMSEPAPAPADPGSAPAGDPAPAPEPEARFTQADLDKAITDRLARQAKKYADYDDLKAQSTELATLREQQMTTQEKAIAEAVAAARAEKDTEYAQRDRDRGVQMVDSFLSGATGPGGRLDAAKHGPILEALDKTKYLTAEGGIDTAALGKLIDSLAPVAPAEPPTPRWPGMGQGRQETPPPADVRPGVGRLRNAFNSGN